MFNKPITIFIVLLCVVIAFSVCRRIYEYQRNKALRAAPVTIYKTTPMPANPAIKKTTKVGTTDNLVPVPTSASMEPDKTQDSSEVESAIVSESSVPDPEGEAMDASEKSENSEDAEEANAEEAERQAALQKRFAETDALLEEANTIVGDGKASLHQAGTALANFLTSLPREKQVTFLEETRRSLMSKLPSDADQEAIEKGWQMYLDMLSEAGYTVPAEVR